MSISYNGAEEVVLEIINLLADNMAGELDTLEAEYTGELALTLEDIKRIFFGDVEKPSIQDMPGILVIPNSYELQTRGMANVNADNVSVVVRVIIYLDPNIKMTIDTRNYFIQEVLTIKLIRYLKAARNILMKKANRGLADKIDRVSVGTVRIGKVEPYENVLCRSGEVECLCYGKPKAE